MRVLARYNSANWLSYAQALFGHHLERLEYAVRFKGSQVRLSAALAALVLVSVSTSGAFAQSSEQRQFNRLTGISDGSVARVVFDRRRKRKPIQMVYFPKRISSGRLAQVQEHVCKKLFRGLDRQGVDESYRRYAANPASVDAAWAAFFEGMGNELAEARAEAAGPSWARADWPPAPAGDLTGAMNGGWPEPAEAEAAGKKIKAKAEATGVEVTDAQIKTAVLDSIRALMIIRAYRIRGHLVADLDPLGMRQTTPHPELDPKSYGFTDADMDRPIFIDNVLGLEIATMRQIVDIVRKTYCGTFALQYMHISNPEEAGWLKERIEGYGKEIAFTKEGRKAILNKLVEAEGFEKFLHVKYMGTKRFGLDGGESLIPAMEQVIKRGGQLGVREIVIGMPHRGRLSVLANVMQKPYRAIFNEFQGGSFKQDGRHHAHRGQQPNRFHNRAAFQPLIALPHRQRAGGRGTDFPRER